MLSLRSTLLYEHPCSWVFVDDESRFLESLELFMPAEQPTYTFTNVHEALAKISENRSNTILRTSVEEFTEDIVVNFDVDWISRSLVNPSRFDEISVVVSDFAMPAMNGLDFFKDIKRDDIGKILLTGAADEKLAVEAFNCGLIDRFILKSDPDAIIKVANFASDLSFSRFRGIQRELATYLSKKYDILSENGFLELFRSVIKQFRIVEYYITTNPLGFLCLKSDGSAIFLAMINSDQLLERNRDAIELAPLSMKTPISRGEVLTGLFEDYPSNWGGDYDWRANTISLDIIPDTNWFYGIHESPPLDVDYEPKVSSFIGYQQGRV